MAEDMDLRSHLVDDVLSWWLRHGPDLEHGGVFTCWDNRGAHLISTDKYTWSQGRWIWLTARLAEAVGTGALPAQGDLDADRLLQLARGAAAFVRQHAVLPDLTTAYVTDQRGSPFPPTPGSGLHTSVFADCFVALGLAALARVDNDADSGALADALLDSADVRIQAGQVRTDPYPVHASFAAFALPMILVGTAAEVHRATGSARSADIAVRAARAISDAFRTGSDLVELQPRVDGLDDTLLARHRTPGHALECLWFLVHAADVVPGVDRALHGALHGATQNGGAVDVPASWLPQAALRALEIGWDDEYGGLFRYVDLAGGQPTGRLLDDAYERLVRDTWDTKLWWPHAEAMYTTALLSRRNAGTESPATGNPATGKPATGNPAAAELAWWYDRLSAYTFETFPAGPGREWIQIRQRDGSPLDQTVALPVKDPFHIARSLLLLVELDVAERNAL
ncbi:AGE family epimerase/isomerase [Actinopolymorpha alba]|uniref:AGE family epimerase/isomerase n=1 Tax=Actinopolymorpha alba TaxID=533267 RepID=UPI00039C6B62|nr:AGE family epimerase/isomerase [Actinopolymorpha alba]